jgi:hypothetical protein
VQDEMIASVAGMQPRTAVVVHTPGALLMPWADAVQAVLLAWLPGQEDGHAIEVRRRIGNERKKIVWKCYHATLP